MLRKFLATVILVVSLEAASSSKEKFQVIANNVNSKNNIVVAVGDVVVFSPTYYITAQKVIYDKENETFELFDDVVIVKDNNVQTKSDYAFLEVKTKNSYQKPAMIFEDSSSVWINSKDSQRKDDVVKLDSSILSSCDCVDPDWSIRASSVDYDTQDMWIDAYNARLYFGELPVFYTPYWGFSTDTTRRTGLLFPTFGYSKTEGAFYSQPIFIAPAPNYDIELIPQYRAKRGAGMYAYIRYADSIDSMLKLSGGYFKEKKNYQDKNNLRNKEHYGIDVDYERYNLFTKKSSDKKDGLFVELNYLNDTEYRNLEDDKYSETIESKVESKINYIFDTPDYFLGSYFRYYINLSSDSNASTLQELPKLQAHKYSKPLLDKLMYSTDFKYTNHTRKNGLKADQYELNVPFSYSFSFFDDYLKLILKQETTLNKYKYSGSDINLFKDGTYGETNSIISLKTDLLKPYENYLHTINLDATYIKSNKIIEDGDLYNITNNSSTLSPFPISKSSDSITLSLNQSLYDKENLRQIINHKLSQSILYDEFDDAKLQNLKNEIKYNYIIGKNSDYEITGTIANNLVYNQQDKEFIESSSSFSLNYNKFELSASHYMSEDTPNSGKDNLESYSFTTKYKFSDRYSASYYTNYNVIDDIRSNQILTFTINDRCWNLDIRYEKELKASSTNNNKPLSQDIIYFQLELLPLGGFIQKYEVHKDENF